MDERERRLSRSARKDGMRAVMTDVMLRRGAEHCADARRVSFA